MEWNGIGDGQEYGLRHRQDYGLEDGRGGALRDGMFNRPQNRL